MVLNIYKKVVEKSAVQQKLKSGTWRSGLLLDYLIRISTELMSIFENYAESNDRPINRLIFDTSQQLKQVDCGPNSAVSQNEGSHDQLLWKLPNHTISDVVVN